jgi:hypothetical protein
MGYVPMTAFVRARPNFILGWAPTVVRVFASWQARWVLLVSARSNVSQPLDQADLVVATVCEVLAWIHRSRRRSSPVTRRLHAPFRPQPRMRNLFSARSPPESQPAISLFFVPRGAILFSFLSSRLLQSAMGGELLSVGSIDPLPIQEICQGVLIFRESLDHPT